ncbi:tetratricopeptide repeat protein [Neolewinella aurantiaca]|uniref:histidine kinase n=1 Tax=Neolewinella aurantiaca TaxID=2602767 RepID=A0A5C7FS00_9BACT|nr:ATP-binding protein [Neolewinella aurantiaca]TXF89163.1 tetratricopeptide repeat protein [Neolewinella aurantiaca]
MRHYLVVPFVTLVLFATTSGLRAQTDSLLSEVARPGNDTSDLNALYELVKLMMIEDTPRAKNYALTMGRLADRRELPTWSALGYRTLGSLHYLTSDIDSFSYYNALALSRIGDPAVAPKIGVGILVNKGVVAIIQYRFDDAVGDYAAAYDLAMSSGYTKDLPKILNNLGVLYRRLNRPRSAERTYKLSLEMKEEVNDSLGMAATLHNLGRVEIELNKVKEGLETLDRSAGLYVALGHPEELPAVEISRGIGFYDLGELDKAESLIKKALEAPNLKLDAFTMANALLGLGEMARKDGRYVEAREHLEEGLAYAKKTNVLALVTNFNRSLGQTYQQLEDQEMAFSHFAFYVDTIEHVFEQERLDVYGEAAEKFQAQLREAEIERQQLIIGQQRQRSQMLWLGLGLFALLSAGTFLLLRSRLKFQKSEALRKESERKAEVRALKQEAEVNGLRSMIEGQEVERKRVAKDLHDGLGGLLATVKSRLANEAPTAVAASQLLDRACTEVRRIAHNMMPQTLALSGLSGSVRDMVDQLNLRGLETELEIVGQPDLRLNEDGQAMILRILQELTHNVMKHAQANKLFLQLIDQPNQLMLTVEDDGIGFDATRESAGGGIGLENIESRVHYLNGEIQYDSSPGHGTTVTLTVPLDKPTTFSNAAIP